MYTSIEDYTDSMLTLFSKCRDHAFLHATNLGIPPEELNWTVADDQEVLKHKDNTVATMNLDLDSKLGLGFPNTTLTLTLLWPTNPSYNFSLTLIYKFTPKRSQSRSPRPTQT